MRPPVATPALGAAGAATTSRRAAHLVALALAVIVSFVGLGASPLDVPDETRVAEIAREIVVGGDAIVLHLNGQPFLEHPPLYYMAVAGTFALLGVSDTVARLPTALATLLTLLIVHELTRRLAGARAATLALMALAASFAWSRIAHRCVSDAWLTLFVTGGLAAFVSAAWPMPRDGPDARTGEPLDARAGAGRPSAWAMFALYVAATLAFLTKGPVGWALLGFPCVVAVCVARRRDLLAPRLHVPGLLLTVAVVASWLVLLRERAGTEALDSYLRYQVWGRFDPSVEGYRGGHDNPFWSYLAWTPQLVAPWTFALPAVLLLALRRVPERVTRPEALRFLGAVLPLGLLLLSVPGTKRPPYAVPLLPCFAMAVGVWLDALLSGRRPTWADRAGLLPLSALVTLPALLVTWPFRLLAALAAPRRDRRLPVALERLAAWARRGIAPGDEHVGTNVRRVAVGMFVIALAGQIVGNPFGEDTDLTPMAHDLQAMDALGDSFVGYRLDERVRAVIPLRTGVLVDDAPSTDELTARMGALGRGRVLIENSPLERLDPSLRQALRPVRSWTFGRKTYVLLDFGTPTGDGGTPSHPGD